MKKILLLSIGLNMVLALYSQQVPQVNHFWYDHSRVNPGSAGSKDMICVSLITRQNLVFMGFPGAPSNTFLNFNAPFGLFNKKHGVGVSIYMDEIGFNEDINLSLSYAYRQPLGDGHLGIGISGEVLNRAINPSWITPENEPATDMGIPEGDQNEMGVNLSAGLFYRSDDIYFGLSAKNVFSPKVIEYTSTTTGGSSATENLKPHFYATAGYTMQLNNPSFEYTPALLIKSDVSSVNIDFNNTLMYNKKIWGGVTYRHGAAVIGLFGLTIYEDIRISYAYEFQTTAMNKYSGGTHEFLLNYCFKIGVEKSPQKYRSIRYL